MLTANSININKRQTIQETWKCTRKLFIQFLPLIIFFAITDLPWALRQALRATFPDALTGTSQELEFFLANLTTVYQLAIVFIIFLNQPELRSKFRQLMERVWMKARRTIFGMNQVVPTIRVATIETAQELL
ncbi:unnamed protein product [Adineta steineri]|uniref:Uncharacterized protein n=1 Tax=Adineta steineri TaxID=433720 RepID=A0A818N4W4_9BILA|nr:unnamed protein product [Adineta steineri]CAF3600435.1 unnamed protein product [Adineta steineri]